MFHLVPCFAEAYGEVMGAYGGDDGAYGSDSMMEGTLPVNISELM